MNAWCNRALSPCAADVKAKGGALPLVALRDQGADGTGEESWRCYSPTCLDSTQTHYVRGNGSEGCALYCSRDSQLRSILSSCTSVELFRNGDNSTACFRIPNVIRGKDKNTLLVFAEARTLSCSDSGPKSLAMRRSTDGGATWEPTRFLATDKKGTKDGLNLGASVYDPETGTVFVHYGVCGHACRPAGTTYVLSSSDDGLTWSSANITDMVIAAGWSMINAGPGTGVYTSTGRLVVGVWGRRLNSSENAGGVASLYSDDHGSTWNLGDPILADDSARIGPNECQLASLANGTLLLNVRNAFAASGDDACRCRLMTASHDGGKTWSPFWRVPSLTGPVCQGSMISVPMGSSSDPRTVLFFSHPASLESREDGYVRASVDDGRTWWLRGGRIDDASSPGFAYSGLVDLGEAEGEANREQGSLARLLGVVYEPDKGSGVVFTMRTVDVSDLIGLW